MMKICTDCGEEKQLSEFHKDRSIKGGYKAKCKKCYRKAQKVWEDCNRDKRRKYRLKAEYGISIEHYNMLLSSQKGQCAICGIAVCPTGKRLAVDHCHTTNKVRGLLCQSCNTGLGKFKDNISNLEKAIKYLKNKDNSDELQDSDDESLTSW